MDREIKFRIYVQMLEGLKKFAVTSIEYERHSERSISKVYIGDSYIDGQYLKDGLANIVQFTGLNDKNGVPIYEGDIVVSFLKNEPTNTVDEVVFAKGQFQLSNNEMKNLYIGDEQVESLEVIGNKYSNPELLKQKDGN